MYIEFPSRDLNRGVLFHFELYYQYFMLVYTLQYLLVCLISRLKAFSAFILAVLYDRSVYVGKPLYLLSTCSDDSSIGV
jgi:hypothetical protein